MEKLAVEVFQSGHHMTFLYCPKMDLIPIVFPLCGLGSLKACSLMQQVQKMLVQGVLEVVSDQTPLISCHRISSFN